MSKCCNVSKQEEERTQNPKFDIILWGSLAMIAAAFLLQFAQFGFPGLETFTHTVVEIFADMWWGVLLGVLIIGLMSKVPKTYFNVILGRGDSIGGIFRATLAGLVLDLCNHGILLVAAKLYERGASLAQVMAFLIASPWNSFSLTIILIALVGLKWTVVFVVTSAVVAFISGFIYLILVKNNVLPDNPNTASTPEDFHITQDLKERWRALEWSGESIKNLAYDITIGSWKDAKMLLRWLLLGVVIAAAIRAYIPADIFANWFGPTMIGLSLTLIASTIIEVCSEGSAPIAAELLHQAKAPGNAFTFLMAGASTDYTEIMIMREATKSWMIALSLPLITVPQIVVLGYIINLASVGG